MLAPDVNNKTSWNGSSSKNQMLYLIKCWILYSLIVIMLLCNAQFCTLTSTKNYKLSYKLFQTNVYVSAFN